MSQYVIYIPRGEQLKKQTVLGENKFVMMPIRCHVISKKHNILFV